jgi:chromosome segregation ATPase
MTTHAGPSAAETAFLRLVDQFYSILERRGHQAALEFAETLEETQNMLKHTYVDRRRRKPAIPPGGAVAEARAKLAAFDGTLDPRQAELKLLTEERLTMRERLSQLADPDSFDQVSEAQELEIRLKLTERKIAKLDAELREPQEARARASRSYVMLQRDARTLEQEIAALADQLGEKLAQRAYYVGELAPLTIEVEP